MSRRGAGTAPPPRAGRWERVATGSDVPVPRGLLGRVVGLGFVSVICAVGLLATSGWLITRASLRPPVLTLSIAIGAVQAFALGRGVARYYQRLQIHDFALRTLSGLRVRLYDTLEPLVPGGLPGRSTGEVVSSFVSDADVVAQGIATRLGAEVDVLASIVTGVALTCLVAPAAGAVLAAGALGTVLVMLLVARAAISGASDLHAERAELAHLTIEAVRSARELVAFGREDLVAGQLEVIARRSTRSSLRRSLVDGLTRAAGTWCAGAALIAVLGEGLSLCDGRRLSGVMLAVVVLATLAVLDACTALPAALAGVRSADAAARRLAGLEELDAPAPEADGGVLAEGGGCLGAVPAALEDVAVRRQDTVLLDDVSLDVPAGRRVGLVGPSGSGKTSALFALLHFLSCDRGRASVAGADVSRLSRRDLARQVAWLPDESPVFAASVADNLRLARPSATDAECVEVLGRVGLATWYASLPDGLATRLGAGGRPVSAGERQRLGMGRALMAGGGLLLLDEPTAHVDPPSARRLLEELLGAAGARSVLVVSHGDDLEELVDDVMALDGGRVVGRWPGGGRSPALTAGTPAASSD